MPVLIPDNNIQQRASIHAVLASCLMIHQSDKRAASNLAWCHQAVPIAAAIAAAATVLNICTGTCRMRPAPQ